MSIFLFLLSGAVFAFAYVFWKNRFQTKKNIGEMPSNSTTPAPIRRTSTWSTIPLVPERTSSPTWLPRRNTDRLSVNNVSQDILNDFPHSVATQQRVLVNFRIVEYKLIELEHFLIIKGFNGSLATERSTE